MAKKKIEEPVADAVPLPDPYPYATPRYLHKPGEAPRLVCSPQACEDALTDGWVVHPSWFVA